jgi:hypothetical protein
VRTIIDDVTIQIIEILIHIIKHDLHFFLLHKRVQICFVIVFETHLHSINVRSIEVTDTFFGLKIADFCGQLPNTFCGLIVFLQRGTCGYILKRLCCANQIKVENTRYIELLTVQEVIIFMKFSTQAKLLILLSVA